MNLLRTGTVFVQPESVDSSPAFQELETSRAKGRFKGILVLLTEYALESLNGCWSEMFGGCLRYHAC